MSNVPTRAPGASVNPDAKKQQNKSIVQRPPRELDANGNPIKKARAKRAPRPIEEVAIYFRVRTMLEKLEQQQADAGFLPTPEHSDNEGEQQEEGDQNAAAKEEQMNDEGAAAAA